MWMFFEWAKAGTILASKSKSMSYLIKYLLSIIVLCDANVTCYFLIYFSVTALFGESVNENLLKLCFTAIEVLTQK